MLLKLLPMTGTHFSVSLGLGLESAWVKQSAGNVALFWNWIRVLEWIAESGETCLLTWDDRCLTVPFDILEDVVAELYTRPETFYGFQLRLRAKWSHLNAVGRLEFSEDNDVEGESLFFRHSMRSATRNYFPGCLEKGLLGFDESMVLSPRGAQWLWEQMVGMEDLTEELIGFTFDEQQEDLLTAENLQARQRSRLNNDNWLWWGNMEAIATAIKENKGFYHPRRIGYAFIEDWMPLGTNVHWKVEKLKDWDIDPQSQIRFMEL